MTGSEIERVEKSTITSIIEELGAKGIQIVYGANICYDAAAMRRGGITIVGYGRRYESIGFLGIFKVYWVRNFLRDN